jgi:hypothetical protein
MNPYQPYRDLLAKMPAITEIEADAQRMYPQNSSLAACYAGGMFRGLYFFARDTLETVLDRVEREHELTRPDDPEAVDFGGKATDREGQS